MYLYVVVFLYVMINNCAKSPDSLGPCGWYATMRKVHVKEPTTSNMRLTYSKAIIQSIAPFTKMILYIIYQVSNISRSVHGIYQH